MENAFKLDLDSLEDEDYRFKIADKLHVMEKWIVEELNQLGLSADLGSDIATRYLNGFPSDGIERGKKEQTEFERIATKYLTLRNIFWAREAISFGRLIPAILFALDAGLTLLVADYAAGRTSRKSGQAAAAAKSARGFEFYKELLARDEELKNDPNGRYADGRAWQISIELAERGIVLTPEAIKKGLASARKKLEKQRNGDEKGKHPPIPKSDVVNTELSS